MPEKESCRNEHGVSDPGRLLKDLNLSNDFMFSKTMQDRVIMRLLLQAVLGTKIEPLSVVHAQDTVSVKKASKDIRIDTYAADASNNHYAVEMQTSNKYNLGKRSRYYHSAMDMNMIQEGVHYRKLGISYVIFICTYDEFGCGLHRYTCSNKYCYETGSPELNEDTVTIILNTNAAASDISEELSEFFKYVSDSTDETAAKCRSKLVQRIHRRVSKIRFDPKMEVEYLTLLERIDEATELGIEQGLEQGLERGQIIKLISIVQRKVARGMNADEIAEVLEEPLLNVQPIFDMIRQHPDESKEEIFNRLYS